MYNDIHNDKFMSIRNYRTMTNIKTEYSKLNKITSIKISSFKKKFMGFYLTLKLKLFTTTFRFV